MKKFLITCFIAASTFAIASSANSKHFVIKDYSVYSDTTPMGMDTMNSKMDKKGKKMHHKMNKDSGMTMQADSATTAPPQK